MGVTINKKSTTTEPPPLNRQQPKPPGGLNAFYWYQIFALDSAVVYDKRENFDFEIDNFPFLDGDVPRSISYAVYISKLIRFARASSHFADFNTRNKLLAQKLLKQGYQYHKLRKTFSKFYGRYYDLLCKFRI